MIQARTPRFELALKVVALKVIVVENDANPISPGKELELDRI
jgi:hypothetical protein